MRISRNCVFFLFSSLHLCTHWYSTQSQQLGVHNIWTPIWFPVQAPITSSQCWASMLLSSTESPVKRSIFFRGCGSFGGSFNIHSPMKYGSANGFGWQLIRQVRGRKRGEWGKWNAERHFSNSCCETQGMNRENRGICKWGVPINQHSLFVRGSLPFLSPQL